MIRQIRVGAARSRAFPREIGDVPALIRLVDPQYYLEFNCLIDNANAVLVDSGGETEVTTVVGVPCVTRRDTTERPETVMIGTNELTGTDPTALRPVLDRLFAGSSKKGAIPELWDGQTAPRIVAALEMLLASPVSSQL